MDKAEINQIQELRHQHLPLGWSLLKTATKRISLLLTVVVIILSVAITMLDSQITQSKYELNNAAQTMVGTSAYDLKSAITMDKKNSDLVFKQDVQTPSVNASKKQNNDGQYSVTIKNDPKEGINYFDPDSNQSFSIKPMFDVLQPRVSDNRVVIPAQSSNTKQVFTFLSNGVKEDVVLPTPQGDQAEFSYKLDLPASLEARLLSSGEVGIYTGSDNVLFKNKITYGSDNDRKLVEKAQAKAKKDKLVFVLPAPVIKQAGDKDLPPETFAKYSLKDNQLKVKASGLNRLQYPISIDPSAIITSATDFDKGNNEGNATYGSGSAQIKRAAVQGGDISGWTSATTTGLSAFNSAGSIAYNNKLYVIGGCTAWDISGFCITATGNVSYISLDNSGAFTGSWSSTNALPVQWYSFNATTYNGYVYVGGGVIAGSGGVPASSAVYYAKINSDGTLGTWTTTSSFNTARADHGFVATKGYIYALAGCTSINAYYLSSGNPEPGCTSGNWAINSERALIKADGTLDSWTTFTGIQSCGENVCAGTTTIVFATVYQDSIYVSYDFSSGAYATTFYAVNSNDGSLTSRGAFISSSIVSDPVRYIYAGYAYTAFGYISLNSSGTGGDYQAGSSNGCGNGGGTQIIYKDHAYCVGTWGISQSPYNGVQTVQYSTYKTAASMGSFVQNAAGSTGSLPAGGETRDSMCTAVYSGYAFLAGGQVGTLIGINDVLVAPITTGGNFGAWTIQTNTFATNSDASTERMALTCQIYNNYLYIMGGDDTALNDLTDIQYAPIDIGSALSGGGVASIVGAFTVAKGKLPVGVKALSSAVVKNTDGNTYIYAMGGCTGGLTNCVGQGTAVNTIYYGKINPANGDVCAGGSGSTWDCSTANTNLRTTTTSLWSTLNLFGTVVNNGYLYTLGGQTGVSTASRIATVEYIRINNGSNGDITGSWTVANSMIFSRARFNGILWNGCIYALGGVNSSNTSLNNSEYACFNAGSPSISSWTAGSALLSTRVAGGYIGQGGYAYIVGGLSSGTRTRTATWAPINNGGGGSTATINTETNHLTYATSAAGVVAYNGYLYMAGGFQCTTINTDSCSTTAITNQVYMAVLNSNGSVGTWSATSSMGTSRLFFSLVAYNGVLYALGGCTAANCSPVTNTVEQATINTSNGTLSAWSASANNFTTGRWGHSAVVYNGYLYVAGGCTTASTFCLAMVSDIQISQLSSSGVVGAWSTSANTFTTVRDRFFMTTYNNYLYIGGGVTVGSSTSNTDVQYSLIGSNGTLGSFTTDSIYLEPYTSNNFYQNAYAENGYLNIFGGAIAGQIMSIAISNSGYLLGNFSMSSGSASLGASAGAGFVHYGGYGYVVGGAVVFNSRYTVSSFSMRATPRVGMYSKLIDTDVDTTPLKLYVTGTNTGNPGMPGTETLGGLGVRYKTVTNSGTTGVSTIINPGLGSILSTLYPLAAYDSSGVDRGVARGYLITFVFDGSQTGTYPDSSGNASTVTGYTLWYHPGSEKRLRGGQTFTGESLQSLDAPPP